MSTRVKADDFIEGQAVLAGLQDGAAPSLQPVARRALALNLEAGPAVGQQHETGGARDQMCARMPHGFPCFGREVEFARNSVSALVRRMTGQNRPVPRRLSRTRCRFERRGLPVKYALGSRTSTAAALGASSTSRVRPVRVS